MFQPADPVPHECKLREGKRWIGIVQVCTDCGKSKVILRDRRTEARLIFNDAPQYAAFDYPLEGIDV